MVRGRDQPEAASVANDSAYGLGASMWTDPDRGEMIASSVEAGMVFINEMVASDARLRFGGVKRLGTDESYRSTARASFRACRPCRSHRRLE